MNLRDSLVVKLWFTIIVIVTAVLIILSISLTFYFKNYALNNSENNLLNDLERIEQEILMHHEDAINTQKVHTENNLIVYQNGRYVSANSETDKIIFDYIINDRESNSDTLFIKHGENKEYMVKVLNMSQYYDTDTLLIKYSDMSPIYKSIRDITMIISISAFIIFIVTTLFSFLLIRKITDPLIALRDASLKMASGQFSKLEVKSFDEIGELTLAFNKMSEDIKDNIRNLEHEKNLRESIFTSISDGILFFDENNNTIFRNKEGDIWLKEIIHQESLVDTINFYLDKTKVNFESFSITESVNEDTYVEISFTPVVYSENIGVTVTIRNITSEKKLEDMRAEFISSVSHELKTPMVMITGYSEALLDGIVTDKEEVNSMLSIIKDESDRMNHLINELIEVNKLEFNSDLFNIKDNDFNKLMDDIEKRFSYEAKDNNLNFEVINTLENSIFPFDYDKMYQVFTNLIDNAIRYTTAGDSIIITLNENKNNITIKISDTGIGMKASTLNRIFERFFKEDKARTRGKQGTGLGLSIVKSIINKHNGTIDVESEYNKGTTFIITLSKEGQQ